MDELFQVARQRLGHVFWLGGPGCSGKSSTARMLGEQLNFRIYHVDDELSNQTPEPDLILPQWQGYDLFGRRGKPLLHLPASDVAACVTDGWQTRIFVQTLKHLLIGSNHRPVIVEGVFLPGPLLKVADPDRIVVMTSSRAFREQYFDHRYAWFEAYADRTAAFQTALDALDEMDRQWKSQATLYQVRLIQIQLPQEIGDAATQIAAHFKVAH
jgi:hypothetical protein